jgi:hypothetical protein
MDSPEAIRVNPIFFLCPPCQGRVALPGGARVPWEQPGGAGSRATGRRPLYLSGRDENTYIKNFPNFK